MTGEPSVGRWLSIVGIGEDGLDGLSPAARRAIAQASLVAGGKRHLALAGAFAGERLVWPSPPDAAFPTILAHRGRPVCVLATGNPCHFGIGSLLMRHVPPHEVTCLPAPSAFSLAAARLGWALQDCATMSLHGRALETIIPVLQPGAKVLALSWDGTTPGKLARLLTRRGFGPSRMTVLEAMGGAHERVLSATASAFDVQDVDPLNTVALDLVAEPHARVLPRAPGLPDDWFEHDGQITKRDIRAITLSRLEPRQGAHLWDVGAGCGSVAIEWLLCHGANRAAAVEARRDRADRIHRNAALFGTVGLNVVVGTAPEALLRLEPPDAVFVGGGVSRDGVLDACIQALRHGGHLVANAVTLAGQGMLLAQHAAMGGELVTVQVARAHGIGTMEGWRPAMPVMQWSFTKP